MGKADGSFATLSLAGQKLYAWIASPEGAVFETASAEQPPPQKANKGVRRLLIRLAPARGTVRIAVVLSPSLPGRDPRKMELEPLARW